jgi:hypothetical protein
VKGSKKEKCGQKDVKIFFHMCYGKIYKVFIRRNICKNLTYLLGKNRNEKLPVLDTHEKGRMKSLPILLHTLKKKESGECMSHEKKCFTQPSMLSRGLLGCDAVKFCGRIPTFQRALLPPLPRIWKSSPP